MNIEAYGVTRESHAGLFAVIQTLLVAHNKSYLAEDSYSLNLYSKSALRRLSWLVPSGTLFSRKLWGANNSGLATMYYLEEAYPSPLLSGRNLVDLLRFELAGSFDRPGFVQSADVRYWGEFIPLLSPLSDSDGLLGTFDIPLAVGDESWFLSRAYYIWQHNKGELVSCLEREFGQESDLFK